MNRKIVILLFVIFIFGLFYRSSNSGSALCVFVFIIIYFFLMAGLVWFGILSYVWYVMFRVVGKGENTLYGKVSLFN